MIRKTLLLLFPLFVLTSCSDSEDEKEDMKWGRPPVSVYVAFVNEDRSDILETEMLNDRLKEVRYDGIVFKSTSIIPYGEKMPLVVGHEREYPSVVDLKKEFCWDKQHDWLNIRGLYISSFNVNSDVNGNDPHWKIKLTYTDGSEDVLEIIYPAEIHSVRNPTYLINGEVVEVFGGTWWDVLFVLKK